MLQQINNLEAILGLVILIQSTALFIAVLTLKNLKSWHFEEEKEDLGEDVLDVDPSVVINLGPESGEAVHLGLTLKEDIDHQEEESGYKNNSHV